MITTKALHAIENGGVRLRPQLPLTISRQEYETSFSLLLYRIVASLKSLSEMIDKKGNLFYGEWKSGFDENICGTNGIYPTLTLSNSNGGGTN